MIRWILRLLLLGTVALNGLVFASSTPITGTPVPQFSKLEKDVTYFMRRHAVPGASMAIMRNGKLLYSRGIGWADVDRQRAVQPDSLFRIASISKAVTSAAIIQLIQEDKLDFDSKVFDVLGDLHPLPTMKLNPAVKRITVVDLLRMLSGWDGDSYIGFDPVFGPWPQSYARKLNAVPPVSCQLAAQFMMGMPLQSTPGTHFSYANINFCLLGLIVNKLGGTPYGYQGYEAYVREHLLAPMGITDMRIGSTEPNEAFPNEVHYYATSAEPNPQLPYGHEDILHKAYAVGGWVASAVDLVKFANGVGKLFNKTSLYYMEEMPPGLHYRMVHGYYPTHYAMGWFLTRRYNGYTWVTHGSFTGTRSVIVKRPDGYIIAVIFNKEPWPQGGALSQITYVLSQAKF